MSPRGSSPCSLHGAKLIVHENKGVQENDGSGARRYRPYVGLKLPAEIALRTGKREITGALYQTADDKKRDYLRTAHVRAIGPTNEDFKIYRRMRADSESLNRTIEDSLYRHHRAHSEGAPRQQVDNVGLAGLINASLGRGCDRPSWPRPPDSTRPQPPGWVTVLRAGPWARLRRLWPAIHPQALEGDHGVRVFSYHLAKSRWSAGVGVADNPVLAGESLALARGGNGIAQSGNGSQAFLQVRGSQIGESLHRVRGSVVVSPRQ